MNTDFESIIQQVKNLITLQGNAVKRQLIQKQEEKQVSSICGELYKQFLELKKANTANQITPDYYKKMLTVYWRLIDSKMPLNGEKLNEFTILEEIRQQKLI